MIKPEMIPDEVVEAAREAWLRSDVNAREDWRAAIAAALNAWPDMEGLHDSKMGVDFAIILPLKEKS